MTIAGVPNLVMPSFSHADTPWVPFGEYWIPKLFEMSFQFEDGSNRWGAKFEISMNEEGNPTLLQATILGRVDPYTDNVVKEVSDDEDELEGVQRWQLKVIEKYRYQLLALSVESALHTRPPNPKPGDPYWVGIGDPVFLSETESEKLARRIDEKVRQKVTPEFLQNVANIYTKAGIRNENPIMAIVEQKKCSHRRAQQYAEMARKQGFLPETSPGKVTVKKPPKRKER